MTYILIEESNNREGLFNILETVFFNKKNKQLMLYRYKTKTA